jgi:hypothetical protein
MYYNLLINATAQYMNTTKQPDALLKTVSDRTEIKKKPYTSTTLISVLQISDSH